MAHYQIVTKFKTIILKAEDDDQAVMESVDMIASQPTNSFLRLEHVDGQNVLVWNRKTKTFE